MSTQWFCKIMGEEWGPMSPLELVTVARRGRLSRNDTVRHGCDGTWVRAEIVDGLFNSAPPAATATSQCLAIYPQRPAPAKRSVQQTPTLRYWVKYGDEIVGPFSAFKLRQFAEESKLRPYYLISSDRRRWVAAAQLEGLEFGGAASKASTASIRSAVWLDEPLIVFAEGAGAPAV